MTESAKILYIDDEADLLDLAESFFNEESLSLTTSNSALEAIHLFKSDPFQIVISDACMPEMSGHELLLRLKNDHAFNGYFILVTGDDGLIEKDHLSDYDLVLQKPLSFVGLVDKIKVMILNPKK